MSSASSLCLTTLEYAVKGSQPVVIHCPSCGIRLIIKHHDSLASRLTSVSLLVGMSMFICYNVGVKSGFIHRLRETISRWFGGNERKRKLPKDLASNPQNCMKNRLYTDSLHENSVNKNYSNNNNSNNYKENKYNCDHISAELLTNSDHDSGIDLVSNMTRRDSYYYDEDEFDGQFDELLVYNAAYNNQYNDTANDYYENYNLNYSNNLKNLSTNGLLNTSNSNNPLPEEDDKITQVKTKTITKIDQVLQSIDDIKKSIVEIDDDIYHIAGSTYDTYSPYFLTLSTPALDDFDSIDSSSQVGNKDETFLREQNFSSDIKNQNKNNFNDNQINNILYGNVHKNDKKMKKILQKNEQFQRPTRTSQSSMSDIEQMEWDFDFEAFSPASGSVPTIDHFNTDLNDHLDKHSSDPQSELFEQKINQQKSQNHAHSLLTKSLTDEEKLKNMHDLLDDAKRMGLLNNIIDALNTESSFQNELSFDKNEKKIF